MTIYFLPTSELGLDDQLFRKIENRNGSHTDMQMMWNWLQETAREVGIEIHTFDKWTPENKKPDDVLLVHNHPGETLPWRIFYFLKDFKNRGGFILERRRWFYRNYKYFSRRVLLQGESPMIMPYNYYGNFERIRRQGLYHKILFLSNYYDYRRHSIISPFFDDPKDKFLVMINANMTIHSFKNELYGERIKAIRYFAGVRTPLENTSARDIGQFPQDQGATTKVYPTVLRGGSDTGVAEIGHIPQEVAAVLPPRSVAPQSRSAEATISSSRLAGSTKPPATRAGGIFEGSSGFDLYGYGWEGFPRHPFHFYAGSRVRRAWRGVAPDKMRTMSRYKFALCFENCSYPGYMSEKIYDCLVAGSIPIYLGEPNIEKIIPPSCFIDLRKFSAKGGSASGRKNYEALHMFLSGLTETDLKRYRDAIKSFLNDDSTIKPMKRLVGEIVGKVL